MELNRTDERKRTVRRSSGIVTVDERTSTGARSSRPDDAPAGPREQAAPPDRGPLLKLPRRDLAAEVEVHQITRDEPEVTLEAPGRREAAQTDHEANVSARGAVVDSSIESFVALFREITGFADAVYPGANDSDCEITVLVGRRKLEFQVVSIDRDDKLVDTGPPRADRFVDSGPPHAGPPIS